MNGESDLRSLQRQINELERDLQKLTALGVKGAKGAVRDTPWRCENCRTLLGWYDEGKELMRVRYKQQLLFIRIGVGGLVQSTCPNCSATNALDYVQSE